MVKRVGIVAKIRLESIAPHLLEVAAWLEARGVEPVFETETAALAAIAAPRRVVVAATSCRTSSTCCSCSAATARCSAMADRIARPAATCRSSA